MNNLTRRTMYPDPNDEVEGWKDEVYEETKDMNEEELNKYLSRTMQQAMRQYGLKQAVPQR